VFGWRLFAMRTGYLSVQATGEGRKRWEPSAVQVLTKPCSGHAARTGVVTVRARGWPHAASGAIVALDSTGVEPAATS
jgi:hypothetical protein